jgi:kynureninase
MTAHLLNLVDRHGFTSVASRDPSRLAGTVAIDVPDAKAVSRTLKARDFVVDYRPGVGIRLSPHFYNTMEELDQVVDEIVEIVRTKRYDDRPSSSPVT